VKLRSKATGSLNDQVNENDGLAMTCRQRWSAVKSSRAEAGRPPGSTASIERNRVADVQVAMVEITGENFHPRRAATLGIVVGENSQVACRRAICEYYRSLGRSQ
jgi:hypothetical protein